MKERIAPDQTLLKRLVAVHAPGMGRRLRAKQRLTKAERKANKKAEQPEGTKAKAQAAAGATGNASKQAA